MSLAVVVCPACRGASRVGLDALGQMVACPRCQTPFVAEEDIPIVHPVSRPARTTRPSAVPVAPSPRRRRRPIEDEPEEAPPTNGAPVEEVPDPEHDPHSRPIAGLPVSVLVGLALLPFGIPLLWRVAPLLTGQEAALSLAVPMSLAIAASALCLGVVYTIDWTATTRVKGVLMLVGLSYLSAGGLFFLKKELMDRIRAWGGDATEWHHVSLCNGECRVKMPGPAIDDKDQPLAGLVQMAEGRRARLTSEAPNGPPYEYRFAVSRPDAGANKPDDAWFDRVGQKLKDMGWKPAGPPEPLLHQNRPGRQWTFESEDGVRIVRVYVIEKRVYYLCAEGPKLKDDYAEYGEPFFSNFFVNIK